jgi:hypothetical protein
MAPVFSANLLRRVLPAFEGLRFGFGLDYLWSRWLPAPSYRSAVLDAVQVRHSRPVGQGSLYEDAPVTPESECRVLLDRYNQRTPASVVYGGITRDGVRTGRGVRLMAELYRGWRPLCGGSYVGQKRPLTQFKLAKTVRKVTLRSLDLSPLPVPIGRPGSEVPDLDRTAASHNP